MPPGPRARDSDGANQYNHQNDAPVKKGPSSTRPFDLAYRLLEIGISVEVTDLELREDWWRWLTCIDSFGLQRAALMQLSHKNPKMEYRNIIIV